MRVAGLGFHSLADMSSPREALQLAGGNAGLTALATAADKATAPPHSPTWPRNWDCP